MDDVQNFAGNDTKWRDCFASKAMKQEEKDSFMNALSGDWLCCGSDLQRCTKITRIDSRVGPPAPSERPLIRHRPRKAIPRSPKSPSRRMLVESPRRSPGRAGFLTQGIWMQDSESRDLSLPLMEKPPPNWNQKFVEEAAGLAKPMAACHESESPPCIDWVDTFPPLPSLQTDDVRVESLHLISDTLVEPDESPELSENEFQVSERLEVLGRTRILMASDVCAVPERSRSQGCLARIRNWFQNCGLENTLVAADIRQFGESAMSFAERCQSGDTCALILNGMSSFEIPEEERIEVSGMGGCILSDFWQSVPKGTTVVILADCDELFSATEFEDIVEAKDLKLLIFAVTVDDADLHTSSPSSSLCNFAMLQAADALSLSDGPCKLTCLDFFQELMEQAEDLAADWGLPKPRPFLRCLPDSSLAANTRWPLSRAPQELAREIGANNTAATQTWIRTGAIPRPEFCPEVHRPRPRSESPPRERQAAAEQLAAVGVSIASAALAATAAAVVEAGSATVAALLDVQHSKSLGRQHSGGFTGHQMHKSLSVSEGLGARRTIDVADVPDVPSMSPPEERAQASLDKRRKKRASTDKERNLNRQPRNPSLRGSRSMPQNFGSLELMLSGGGALKKPGNLKPKAPAGL